MKYGYRSKKTCESVELHPVSLEMIQKGHPHVTLDQFSKNFPRHALLLRSKKGIGKSNLFLLNDPDHPKIKARVWKFTTDTNDSYPDPFKFWGEFIQRLEIGFARRAKVEGRDCFYLIFGEADRLPGVFIQKLAKTILVQFSAECWVRHLESVLKHLGSVLRSSKIEFDQIVVQERKKGDNVSSDDISYLAFNRDGKKTKLLKMFSVSEFGVKYEIRFEQLDCGIYLDMSSIRQKLLQLFNSSKSILNLYSYTGAFSLFALKNGASSVASVDLSQKYMDWLNHNITLNGDFDKNKHQSNVGAVKDCLDKYVNDKSKFDLIICDPPSFSTDGKKKEQALSGYHKLIPRMEKLLNNGGSLIIFLNTHSVTRKKFEQKILEILQESKLERWLKIGEQYGMQDDCPLLAGFSEGDYLKGIQLIKTGAKNEMQKES